MAAKKLLTAGNVFKRTDGRWNGVVWYLDEQGERKRKSFSGTSRQEVKDKITAYIAAFNRELDDGDDPKTTLPNIMGNWLPMFLFSSTGER